MSETLQSSLVAAFALIIGGLLTWLSTRGKTKSDGKLSLAQLQANQRQTDIDLIIKTLQAQVSDLTTKGIRQDEKIGALEDENRECWADRDQMRGELSRIGAENKRLVIQVQELAEQQRGGC